MTLSTVFRIQALVFALFGVLMLLVPGSMMESFGIESSAMMAGVIQNVSIMALGIAYLSWRMPSWVGDNLKTVGMFFAIWHLVYLVLSGYQMSTGVFPADIANIIGNTGFDLVLAILFFWKSRADA